MTPIPLRAPPVRAGALGTGLLALGVAATALVAGAVLAAVGALAGPAVMVGLPLTAALAAVVLRQPHLGVAVLVGAMPFGLRSLPGGVDLLQAVAAAVVGLVALSRLSRRQALLGWDRLLLHALVFLAIAVASTLEAPDLGIALRQDVALVLAVLVVCAVLGTCRSMERIRQVLWVVVLVGGATCAAGLGGASQLQARGGGHVVSNRLQGTFSEPNQFGCFSAVVLLLAVGLFLGGRTGVQRAAAGVAGGFALASLGLSLSRGAWIGAATALVVLLVLLPEARRWLLVLSVPLVLLGGSVALFTPDRPEVQVLRARAATFGEVQSNPYDGRPAIWREAQREVVDRPLLGQGPGQFPVVSTRAVSDARTVSAYHAHNVLLTTAAEFGLAATAVLVSFTWAVWGRVRRTVRVLADHRDRAVVAGLASSLAVTVGQGLVDFLFRNVVILTLLSVLLGLALAAGGPEESEAG